MTRPGDDPPSAWNATEHPYRDDVVPARLVLEAAHAAPDAPALFVAEGLVCTYGELVARANRLAHLLQECGAGPGGYVGVVGRHRPDTVVALLAVALTGAAFVPCHPDWPPGRLGHVLERTGARWLVGGGDDLVRLDGFPQAAPGLTDVVLLDVAEPEPSLPHRPEDVSRFWDGVVAAPDPADAAGLNLVRGDRVTAEDLAAYADHVARLVLAEGPSSVLDIGFGSGAVLRRAASRVDLYAGLDPSDEAVRANLEWAKEHDLLVDLVKGFAHEVGDLLPGRYDVALLAGTVQHLPGGGYLGTVLDELVDVVRPGGRVILADVVPPGAAPDPGWLTVPPDLFDGMRGEAWSSVQVLTREGVPGLCAEQAERYDVVLRRSDVAVPGRPDVAHRRPDRVAPPRVWTGWHVARRPDSDVELRGRPGDVSYVIFTSGSTGRPKGVTVSNTALVNMLEWATETFGVSPADRLLQVTSFCFDLSIYDVFGMLAAGASIRLADDEEVAEPARLADVLLSEPITFWNSAPPLFAWVLPFLRPSTPGGASMRMMFLAGDWVALSLPGEIARVFPNATVVNFGGATETTVWSTYHLVERVDPSWASIPYGRPMWNTRYYVLDEHRRPVGVDEPGDLYAAGTSLALGYHADAAQTAQRFVPDPFVPGGRMYAFGDRGRWRPDGELQFLGRVDHQVKVRGFRVELGEIESVMASVPGVRESVVVPVDAAGERLLVAFYTCREPVDVARVRAAVTERLPEYMVPFRIVRMDELPLTANGKVDRAGLGELGLRHPTDEGSTDEDAGPGAAAALP